MRIGNYYIEKKFWIFLGIAILLVFIVIFLLGREKETYNPFVEPAFPEAKMSQLKPGWFDPYTSSIGVTYPETYSTFTSEYSLNLGRPVRFRAYLPTEDEAEDRDDLAFTKNGWKFVPAIWLQPNKSTSPDEISSALSEQLSDQPLMIGFPENATENLGRVYEITGLLYWHSQMLNPEADQAFKTNPVVLAAGARSLANEELNNPTTHFADLDISYQQNNYQLNLRRLEWSSGKQVRLCISITNVRDSTVARNMWPGTESFQATYPLPTGSGSALGETDPESPLAAGNQMIRGEPVSGYIIFNQPPAAGPDQDIKISIPGLNESASGPPTELNVSPNQFKNVSSVDKNSRAENIQGC